MTDRTVGETPRIDPGYGGRHGPAYSWQRPPAPPQPPGAKDQVELSDPAAAALALLRERVLARTRDLLGLPAHAPAAPLPEPASARDPEACCSRVLSEQNLMAAQRAGCWPPAQVRQALADGLEAGSKEALEVLEAVGLLAGEAGEAMAAALADFARRCAPDPGA